MVANSQQEAPGGSPEPPHVILIVEDEVLIRFALAEYLRDCGFKVFEAADAEEAMEVLNTAELRVDLVFSDVQMPEMDGFTLARWIRAHHPEVRVLLTSGDPKVTTDKARALCHENEFFPKPYDHAVLAQYLRRQLARSRNGRS
jgi:DNA-binding response OmpR family regulator